MNDVQSTCRVTFISTKIGETTRVHECRTTTASIAAHRGLKCNVADQEDRCAYVALNSINKFNIFLFVLPISKII